MTDHDDMELDYDIAGRRRERPGVAFDVAPASRRKTQARFARKGKPALKRAAGMHRRGNKRHGV